MFQLEYTVKDEHIDYQDIMDGLYYPYYMELCRHRYVEEVLRFDMKGQAAVGLNMVLSQYFIRFRRALRRGDRFVVTCSAHPDKAGRKQFYFRQDIICNAKVMTEGFFAATCVLSTGGGAYVPPDVASILEPFPPLSDESLVFPRVFPPTPPARRRAIE